MTNWYEGNRYLKDLAFLDISFADPFAEEVRTHLEDRGEITTGERGVVTFIPGNPETNPDRDYSHYGSAEHYVGLLWESEPSSIVLFVQNKATAELAAEAMIATDKHCRIYCIGDEAAEVAKAIEVSYFDQKQNQQKDFPDYVTAFSPQDAQNCLRIIDKNALEIARRIKRYKDNQDPDVIPDANPNHETIAYIYGEKITAFIEQEKELADKVLQNLLDQGLLNDGMEQVDSETLDRAHKIVAVLASGLKIPEPDFFVGGEANKSSLDFSLRESRFNLCIGEQAFVAVGRFLSTVFSQLETARLHMSAGIDVNLREALTGDRLGGDARQVCFYKQALSKHPDYTGDTEDLLDAVIMDGLNKLRGHMVRRKILATDRLSEQKTTASKPYMRIQLG